MERAGYVHDQYLNLVKNNVLENPTFYLCGWRDMIKEARLNLKEQGFYSKKIKLEIFRMSYKIKHECGVAYLRLRKPIQYFIDKYKTPTYPVNKMFLMMHKQRNRGQDGSGLHPLKLNLSPGKRYISRYRSVKKNSIQDIFNKINKKFIKAKENPNYNLEGEMDQREYCFYW
ncbi:MAG: hypothetical protein Ct9H90mP3_3680 [Flammeovirgaceae bacterium]|nr:MAG: hypothetical protein Ct9H90mP3_3680 [Flammeovirgaceae bacterium]